MIFKLQTHQSYLYFRFRIKFSQAEDNLLALGIAQFAKDWKLIQAHLLPVKSSKQLQIRCKNLSSTRAKENVVKYFRRTGEMWPFSTKIVSNVPYGECSATVVGFFHISTYVGGEDILRVFSKL